MEIVEFKRGSVPNGTALWIELPCQPHHDLNWSGELALAKEFKGKIVWYFNLGLEDPFFPIEDQLRFSSIALALQQFTKDVWPNFQEQTLALCLYRGLMADFIIYFQMLAHKLPDEAPIWLLFEVESHLPVSKALQLIFLEGFEHFKIALKGKLLPLEGYRWDHEKIVYHPLSVTTGAVFPTELDALSRFDSLLSRGPVRVIPEAYLSEQWEGLDRLLVVSDSLTIQGGRMLKGFLATGGEVVYL
jgi:hypothetical protein